MLTVTKKFSFCYGHRLPAYQGKCVNYHGHNSEVEVEFTNHLEMPKEYPGMIADFSKIKKIVGDILEQLDHKDLNAIKDFVAPPPTAENITVWLVDKIKQTPLGPGLVRVRMTETPTSWAEWRK